MSEVLWNEALRNAGMALCYASYVTSDVGGVVRTPHGYRVHGIKCDGKEVRVECNGERMTIIAKNQRSGGETGVSLLPDVSHEEFRMHLIEQMERSVGTIIPGPGEFVEV